MNLIIQKLRSGLLSHRQWKCNLKKKYYDTGRVIDPRVEGEQLMHIISYWRSKGAKVLFLSSFFVSFFIIVYVSTTFHVSLL